MARIQTYEEKRTANELLPLPASIRNGLTRLCANNGEKGERRLVYLALRQLFESARLPATRGGWSLDSTYTDPGSEVMTTYARGTATIKCESFDYSSETGDYQKHIFTYTETE